MLYDGKCYRGKLGEKKKKRFQKDTYGRCLVATSRFDLDRQSSAHAHLDARYGWLYSKAPGDLRVVLLFHHCVIRIMFADSSSAGVQEILVSACSTASCFGLGGGIFLFFDFFRGFFFFFMMPLLFMEHKNTPSASV